MEPCCLFLNIAISSSETSSLTAATSGRCGRSCPPPLMEMYSQKNLSDICPLSRREVSNSETVTGAGPETEWRHWRGVSEAG